MSGKVWISSVLSNNDIGMKQGTRTKFYNHEWNPATLQRPLSPEEVRQAQMRYVRGFNLGRSDFPEAAAVFDEKRFERVVDLFWVSGFLVVRGALAELISHFDLGEGGLVPFPIYNADLVTPMEGEFFFINFGTRKNSFLPEQSQLVERMAIDRKTGTQIWDVKSWFKDGDVALSATALEGPDIWFEETVYNKIFMSDELAQALQDVVLAEDWRLKQCHIVEAGQ